MFRKVKFILLLLAVFAIGCNSISENEKIIYISEKDGNPEIYSMNINGSDIQRITNSSRAEENPKLSKDGSYLGFLISKNDIKELHIIEMNNNNKQLQISDKELDVEDFFWSPDSRKLTFLGLLRRPYLITNLIKSGQIN